MLFAINVPQTKSVSIAFVALKSNILGLIMTIVATKVSDSSVHDQCVHSMKAFISVLNICFVLGLILDVFFLGYFYLSK